MRRTQITQKEIREPPFFFTILNLRQICNKKRYARKKWHGFHQKSGPTL